MNIQCKPQLTKDDLNALEGLVQTCQRHDGAAPVVYEHLLLQKRRQNSNLLCYQDDLLIGFLGSFFFFEQTAELSVLVHPQYRHQGIAHNLYRRIQPLLHALKINRLHCSASNIKFAALLQNRGFELLHTEYNLEQSLSPQTLQQCAHTLTLRKATPDDRDHCYQIQKACFNGIEETWLQRFDQLLSDPSYVLLLAYLKDLPIGKVHLQERDGVAWISDLAIVPEYQNQGYGGELLSSCLIHIFNHGYNRVKLDVEITSKEKKLLFYLKHNFYIKFSRPFLSIDRNIFEQFLG